MAAQARSLGFTMVYASQDIPAMKRLNEKEAASIIANTNTKIFMRSEESDVTGKLAVDSAGKGLQARVAGYSGEVKDTGTGYRDNMDASIVESERVNFTDLKAQTEGEMHIMFQEKVVRAKSFYANPEGSINKKIVKLRANHFIKVAKPDLDELEKSRKQPEIMNRLLSEEFTKQIKEESEEAIKEIPKAENDITLASQAFDKMIKKGERNILESACGAVTAVIHNERELVSEFTEQVSQAIESSITVIDDSEDNDVPLKEDKVNEDPLMGDIQSNIIDDLMNNDLEDDVNTNEIQSSIKEKKKSNIKENVEHSVSVDGNEISDMANEISSNETIMKALAALDFEDDTSEDEIDEAVNDAIEDREYLEEEGEDEEEVMMENIEDALMESSDNVFDEEDDEEGDVTTDFLSALFLDDDDD
jgi:intracellular multiplication protein IcmO